MPATTKKPIKIVPNTIKTIPKVPLSPISKSKSFQEKLNDIQNNIDINIDDIPEDLLDIWDELQEDITPKLISKNYKLWLTIFTPFILPGIINGMSGKPSVPQPVVTVQEPAPDPKQIVNFAQKYFAEHGLELCKSLTKTDLNNIKQDLINNWGKGPDAFSKAFQDSYPVSKARLENIYRSERHLAEYNGVLERAKIADHKYKQWRAVGDERSCDLCMSHDMETVPINEPFSNGEMTATGHPQCRCSMVTYSDEDYNEMKENSSYLADAFETIKLNYNCPDDEKIGSGPGSCSGGNTSNLDKVSTLKNKIRELEKSVSEGKSTFDEAYEQYKSIQKELDLELEKEKLRNPDNAKITNDIVTDPEPITPYKALSDYQNYAYTAINDYLRKTNHVKQNPQQTKNIQNMIKTIDSEMENNPLKSDKLVFRADNAGISSDAFEKTGLTNIFKDTFGKESLTLEDFIKNHKLIDKIREKLVGYEYTEKAYLSTGSDKENTMNRFLAPSRDISKYGVTGLINLIVPKGTPAIRIADYTGLEDELGGKIDEYLIGRDQTIVIDQVYIRPADDNRLYLEYNAHIKTNEQKQNSEYLEDVTNFIKLNYNCPDSEKIGSGPGSCGGNKPNEKHEPEKPIFDGVPQDLKLGNEFKSEKQAVSRNEFNFKTEKKQGMYDTVYKIRVIPKKIPTEWKNKKDTLDDKNIWYDPTYMKEIPFGNGKSTVVIPINPEIENQMKLPSGKEKGYLFRGMSYEEFEGIKKNGYIKTEAQYNFDFQGDMTFFSDEKSTAANYASGFAPWQYAPTIDKPAIMIKVKDPGNHEKGTTEGEIGIRGKILDELITEVYVGRPVSMVEGYFEIVDDKYNNNVYRGNASPYKSNVIWEIIPYNKQKQDSSYLEDVTNFIKLNYNCPDSEKIGSGPGSCGGSKPDTKKEILEGQENKQEATLTNLPLGKPDFSGVSIQISKDVGLTNEKYRQELGDNVVGALDAYRRTDYIGINSYLRNGNTKGQDINSIKDQIKLLDSAFIKKTSEPITTFRVLRGQDIINKYQPGSKIDEKAYVSTTISGGVGFFGADSENAISLQIEVPKGTPFVDMSKATTGVENELLLPRNGKLLVKEVRDVTKKLYNLDENGNMVPKDVTRKYARVEYIPENDNNVNSSFQEISSTFNSELGGFHITEYKAPDAKPLRIMSQDKADNAKLLEAIQDLPPETLPAQFTVMKMPNNVPAKYYAKLDTIGVSKKLSSAEMTKAIKDVMTTIKRNERLNEVALLQDAYNTIKLNYRCEENPPGSGNFKCDITKQSDKQLDKTNKLRLKEIKTKIKEVEAKNQAIRDQMDKVPRDSPKWKDLQKQIDTDTPYKLETYAKILSYKHPDIPKEFEPILIESDNIIKNLSAEDRQQLNLYVAGWGNASYQGLLAKWQGNIPEHPEEWVKAEIGKRYSFKDDKSYDPNDPFQVKEFNNSIEAINTRIDQIKKLDGILEKTKLPSDIVVKTGVSSTLLGINELEPGDEINIPTYLSTSRSDTIANGFALRKYSLDFKHYRETRYKDGLIEPKIPIVLEMHLKAGSRALALESFALESQGPDAEYVVGDKGIRGTGSQQEVLLARGTKCTVKAIENTTFRGKQIRKVIVDASN